MNTNTNNQDWLNSLFDQCVEVVEIIEVVKVVETKKQKRVCHKCGGKGYISGYYHIKGGECFSCNGRGSK